MPLPDVQTQTEATKLDQIRNPGFETENLPSPKGFDVAPIPLPGTGQTMPGTGGGVGEVQSYINKVLGTKDRITPGHLPSYTASDVYNPRYNSILPGEDSEEAFAKGQSSWAKWGNALMKMGATSIGTFWNTLAAIPETIASVRNGRPWDNTSGSAIDEWLKNLENTFPNYYTHWEQDHPFKSFLPFSGGFANAWGDKFIKNLGYTVGAIGGAVVQDLALGAATEGIGAIPMVGAQIGKAALALNKLFTGTNDAEKLVALGMEAGRTGKQLLTLEKLAQLSAASKVGDGMRFATALYGAAASEAGVEARDGYNTVRQDLITAYQREHGYSPVGKELDNIENYARSAGNVRFGINLALLSMSDAIQFDNILKPFKAAKSGLRSTITKELEDGVPITLREGSIDTFEEVIPTSRSGKVWNAIKPAIPNILAEGVYEEGGQYAAQVGTENYYERKYIYDKGLSTKQYAADHTPWNASMQMNNVIHSFIEGMGAEFGSTEGLENVFIGGLTGAITGGVQRFFDREKSAQNRTAILKLLNENGVTGTIRNNYDNTVQAHRIAEDMKEAVRTGDLFKYKNYQHEQFVNFITSGIKAGRFDVRLEQIKLLSGMSDEQFKAAFGLDKTTENVKTASEYIGAMLDKANEIKKNYDLVDKTFKNPYKYNRKATDLEGSIENEKHHTFEQWKDELVKTSSIIPEVNRRLYSINKSVKDISQYVSNEQLAELTNHKSLSILSKSYQEQIKTLEDGIKDDLSTNKTADTKKINSLKSKVEAIDKALASKQMPAKLFSDLLNFHINNQSDDFKVQVPIQAIGQLMEYGKDVNRLNEYKQSANDAFDALSSEEGFNKFFKDVEEGMRKADETPPPAEPGAGPTPPGGPTTPPKGGAPKPPTPSVVLTHKGEQRIYDKGKFQYIQLEKGKNPENVEVVSQSGNQVTVKLEDGTTKTVPVEAFFAEDTTSKDIDTAVNEVTSTDDLPPTPPVGQSTALGEAKKDISWGLYSTTDPTYDIKTTPFNNFQRRHQNFLYNLGSTDPDEFNQDNKPRLRILPITKNNIAAFGLADALTAGPYDTVDNSIIRAVYVIDDSLTNEQKSIDKRKIINDIRNSKLGDNIKNLIQEDKTGGDQVIDFIYEQYNQGGSAAENLEKGNEDLIDAILAYKGTGIFYTDEKGNKLGRLGDNVNLDELVFSTMPSTELQFGKEGAKQDRYTNKNNVNIQEAQTWWRGQRQRILDIKNMDDTPLYQFQVSRGIPHIINYNLKNNVMDIGLIKEVDLDKPVITIATLGNVAVMGAFNSEGGGVEAAKESINMPPGTPLLNYGGNLIFLNSRLLTKDESSNIFDILKVIGDRSNREPKAPLFKYLNKVVYLANRKKNIRATGESIMVDGSNLFLGTSTVPINMSPQSMEANKDRIIDFLVNTHHATNNSELNRIKNNPRATDLQFVELHVVNGAVQQKQVWKNYNHYLLSNRDPEGKKRNDFPLSSNIAIPQAGEVPIIQKYSVLKGMEFDSSVGRSTNTDQNTVAGFVDRIANGEKLTSPEDLQFYENNKKEIEQLLQKRASTINQKNKEQGVQAEKPASEQTVAKGKAKREALEEARRKREEELKKVGEEVPEAAPKVEETKPIPEPEPEEQINWVDIDTGDGNMLRVAIKDVVRDKNGNITDFTPVGKAAEDGKTIIPYKNPAKIKAILMEEIQKSQIKQDETNTEDDDFWNNPDIGKDTDPQYSEFTPSYISYSTGELDKEFQEARRMLGDDQVLIKLKDILKTTSGGFAFGAFVDNAIMVWEGGKVGTTHHEVFEKVYGTFLNGKEQEDLYNEFTGRSGSFRTPGGVEIKFSDATVKQAKERIADEFTDYMLTGKLPDHKKQRNFFQRLIDFIKKIIFGDPSKIRSILKKINAGYYRNFSSSLKNYRNQEPQYRELEGFNQAFIQDVMQGMTVEMLMEAFKEGSDIITQLEENEGKPAIGIYGKLKQNLTKYFENTTANGTWASDMKAKRDSLSKNDDKEGVKQQYRSVLGEWEKVKANWDQFVRYHQRYLRVFGVEFEEDKEGNIGFAGEEEYDDNDSMPEYGRDILLIDIKNSASTRIKLLIATLADSEWKRGALEQSVGGDRTGEINIKRDNSLIGLPKQVQYAKLFNYLLHNTAGMNNLYEIWDKLSVMVSDPAARKPIDANIKRLMNRVDFTTGFQGKNINQMKMLLSLEGTLVKQKLGFSRQFVDFQGQTHFKTTVLNSKIDQLKSSWIASIKGSGAVVPAGNNMFRFSPSMVGITDNLQFLERIGIPITKTEVDRLRGSDIDDFRVAVNAIRALVESAAKNKLVIPVVSSKQMDFDGRLNALAEVYATKMVGDDTQSQHPNLDNEQTSNFVLNNAASIVLNDANNSKTRQEFLNKKDNQYFNDIFHKDSIILTKVLFGEDGRFNQPVKLEIVEGRQSWNSNNKAAHRLTEAERQLYELNNNFNGVFYTLLPADAKMEWAIRTGTYLSASNFFGDSTSMGNEVTKFANQMYKWLQTEVDLAKDFDNRKNIERLNDRLGDRKRGNSLRFFLNILPKDTVDKIHEKVVDGNEQLDSVITESDMRTIVRQLAYDKARKTLDNLLDWKVVNITKKGDYRLSGFDQEFLDEHLGKKKGKRYTEEEVLRLIGFREMNYILNAIEMHKMFFGDPAQYKDELKRIKSFLSGREVTHVDTLETAEGYNQNANQVFNKAGNIDLKPGDPGYHFHKNHVNTITIYDVLYESKSIDQIKEAIGDKAKPYTEGNEADAQAWISPGAYREIGYKAAGRYTTQQEAHYQWEMAWERNDKAKEGKYTYTSDELRKHDEELLKTQPSTEVAYQPFKLVHSGMQYENGVAISSLDKASWAPLFYRWVKGRPTLEKLYNAMQQQGIDYVRLESAHKVGIQKASSMSMYNEQGEFNEEGIKNIQTERVSYKHTGVQVEQRKKEKGQTEGTQARKVVTIDLMDNTAPVDFLKEYTNKEEGVVEWRKLSEAQKLDKSPVYAKIRRHDAALRKLTQVRLENAMRKLGITRGLNGVPLIQDKQRVSDFILSEIERRELPRNLAYGLEIDPTTGDFVQPLEANAQYSKIRSVLYSVMESTITRPKVNGGQKTMVSVLGWETGKRIVKKTVNGKPVYTSNELKFYTRTDTGTQACEVMLPYWFGKKLMAMGSGRTKEEVIKYLNSTEEGRKLIRGIGFRIPTQGMNSIDFFVVKDFLPEQMGDVIILPSEITAKAGSDFDIDKLNTYLRNFYVDNETGYPKLVRWKGSEEATKKYIGELLDKGNIIKKSEREELDRIIAEETEDLDQANLLMKIPGVMDMFSEEAITRDFLGKYRDQLINKLYMEALENEFFDSIEDLLSLPENYNRLVAPNDATRLKKLRDKIREWKGETEKEKSLGDYGKLIDSTFMVKERQAYMASKGLVGVAAVATTFHALSQRLSKGLLVTAPWIIARFPHNTLEGKISLSGLYTAGTENPDPISETISQTVDGGVDVSKDKFLAEMGVTVDTAKDFLTLTRAGAPDEWSVAFLNQPAIQEFLKLKAIHDSVSQINPSVVKLPTWKLLGQVHAKYGGMDREKKRIANKPQQYLIRDMKAAIIKQAEGGKFTREEESLQLMMLDDYMNYSNLAWDMFHYYQGYNWDTFRSGDPNAIRLKELKYLKAENLTVSGVSDMLEDTFIGEMKDATQQLDAGLRSAINVQTGAADEILMKFATDLFNQKGLNEDIRKSLLLAIELSMVDYSVQTGSNVGGRPINSYMHPVLIGDRAVAKYINAIKDTKIKRLFDNPFIKNLLVNLDTRSDYPSLIKLAQRDYDTYTSNVWTDGFREMKDDATVISISRNTDDDKTVAQIYKNLALAVIIENGSKRGSNSISHLIPNETYSEFVRAPLKNLHLENFYENHISYRTNWKSEKLVPSVEMEKADPQDDESPLIYPILRSPKVITALKEAMGVDNIPLILNVPEWKYSSYKAVKINDLVRDDNGHVINNTIRLFVRVDVKDLLGETPLTVMKKRIIFKEINAWGDGTDIQEYYDHGRPSILPERVKVTEVEDSVLIDAMIKGGLRPNVGELMGQDEDVPRETEENPDMDDNGNQTNELKDIPPEQPAQPIGVPSRGRIAMTPEHIEQIKAGTKTITNRVDYLKEGIYTMPDGTQVELRFIGKASVTPENVSFSTGQAWDKDTFAKAEGYASWAEFSQKAPFSTNFIQGKQQRNIYYINPFGRGPKIIESATPTPTSPTQAPTSPKEQPVKKGSELEADLKKAADAYLKDWLQDNPRFYWPIPKELWKKNLTREEENKYFDKPGTRITMDNLQDALAQNKEVGDQIGDKADPNKSVVDGITDPYDDYIVIDISPSQSTEFSSFDKIIDAYRRETDPEVKEAVGKMMEKYGLGKYLSESYTGDPNQLSMFPELTKEDEPAKDIEECKSGKFSVKNKGKTK